MNLQFRQMGGMTPQGNQQINFLNASNRNSNDFIIESAHVKHNYNTNLLAQQQFSKNLMNQQNEENLPVELELPTRKSSLHRKNNHSVQQSHNQGGFSSLLGGGSSSNIEVIMETDMEGAAGGPPAANLNEDRFSGVIDTDNSIRNSIVIEDSSESE